ncbi:MAG: YihY family inner membrane protein [Rhodoferax sp.]|nr:MAG: YihY family inner membrane protein [Rhodoferax sp.]
MQILSRLRQWASEVARIPWADALLTLRERFREDRLALTASSLTFTTIISLVPFIAVALAVFTAFPMFAKFQDVLQKWLIESLVPDNIARQVLGYLNQFAGKASKLGAAGIAVLFGTALALVFTIDRTLNSIWRVRTPRPFAQRVLIYWTAVTLGPLMLAVSLSITSYAVSASKGLVGALPGGVGLLLDILQFLMVAAGMAALYRFVPNTFVRWGHAWMGGVFVSTAMELAKKALAIYLSKVPTYSVVYGAFATVPILLVWIYVAWIIVLLGATLTAYIPNLLAGVHRMRSGPGWQFTLALDALRLLDAARQQSERGVSMEQLGGRLRVDTQRLETVMEALQALDWVGLLNEGDTPAQGARFVLLADPATTPLQPLMQRLLLPPPATGKNLYEIDRWPALNLEDAL